VTAKVAAPVDKTPPTGTFKLDYTSAWLGQITTLTLVGVADNKSPANKITKVVAWGDGTTSRLLPTQTSISTQYHTVGKFPVTLTLTDQAGNAKVVKSSVVVSPPAKFALSAGSLYLGQQFSIAISAVPAGTTRIVLYSGDGYYAVLSGRNQTVTEYYYHRYKGALMPAGPVTLTAVFTNKNGSTTPIVVGRVTIKRDVWSPRVTITKPSKSNRASSWKTIRGTATDKGSGIPDVLVVVLRQSGSKFYCYTPKKTWVRIYPSSNLAKCFNYARVSKGKWALAVKGQKRNTKLDVIALGSDWADRTSNTAERVTKLTRS